MISPNSIKEYLGRENLRDSALVKVKDEAHLDSRLAELTNNFKFTTNLRKHQKAGVLLTLRRKAYMLLFDMGLGKTATSLACIEYLKSVGIVTRSIVLVPNISNLFSWENEIKKHTPSLTYASLFGDRAERQEILDGNSDILIATYAGFNSFVTKKVKVKKKNQLVIDKDLATKYSNYFQMVIWDEIPAAKNIHSLIFKAAKWLSAACEYRIGLTGTPFGKDPQDLWAQFYLIDNGETLGETLGLLGPDSLLKKLTGSLALFMNLTLNRKNCLIELCDTAHYGIKPKNALIYQKKSIQLRLIS
jgi:SNF2 family DNA or RNA helicase